MLVSLQQWISYESPRPVWPLLRCVGRCDPLPKPVPLLYRRRQHAWDWTGADRSDADRLGLPGAGRLSVCLRDHSPGATAHSDARYCSSSGNDWTSLFGSGHDGRRHGLWIAYHRSRSAVWLAPGHWHADWLCHFGDRSISVWRSALVGS